MIKTRFDQLYLHIPTLLLLTCASWLKQPVELASRVRPCGYS
jgi:hypothetical protein